MKAIYILILFTIVTSLTLKERIKTIFENEDFLIQVTNVINSIKSKNWTNILYELNDTYEKIKNGTYPCLLYPCDICEDLESYKKCQNTCWSGFFCDIECLNECEKYC